MTWRFVWAVCITLKGISMAYFVASSIAFVRSYFFSSLLLGNANAYITWLNASISATTSFNNSFLYCCPFSAQSPNSFQPGSHTFLWADKFAAIVARDTERSNVGGNRTTTRRRTFTPCFICKIV